MNNNNCELEDNNMDELNILKKIIVQAIHEVTDYELLDFVHKLLIHS